MTDTDTTDDITLPPVVLRALSGQWVPSRRHLVATVSELATMLGISEFDARRVQAAVAARKFATSAKSEHLAGTINGQPDRVAAAAYLGQIAGDQLVIAAEGMALP